MYRKAAKGWMKHLDFLIIDMFCLGITFLAAGYIRSGFRSPWGQTAYRNMFVVTLLINIIMIGYFGTLKNVLKRDSYKEFMTTLRHVCLVMLMGAFFLFITQTGSRYSRIMFVLTGVLYFFAGYASRVFWKRCLLAKGALLEGKSSLLIVTNKDALKHIIGEIKRNNFGRFRVVGVAVLDQDMVGQVFDGIKVVANLETAVTFTCREWIDEVLIHISPEIPFCNDLIGKFAEMGVTVHLNLLKAKNLAAHRLLLEKLGPYVVLTSSINMITAENSMMKRVLDICGGLVGCLLVCVLFIIFAPLIYIKSPGPIFFSQIRVGQNGKKFKIYKFRSMHLDAEKRKQELMEKNRVNNGLMFKLEYDPRIIGSEKGCGKGIGNFIRKYSIDEFPQFWNVLKGNMSLVGTRPPTVDEWEKYALHHRARLAVKPGITGMWQVSGRSEIIDFEEVVRLDTSYIADWSVGLDLRILAKTVKVVLGQSGAM